MAASAETMDRLKRVLQSTLKIGEDAALTDGMPLLGGEYELDSLDVLLLITNVEKEFGIRLREKEVDRSAFATLSALGDLVERLRSGA
jgi:acyl carrier protein